jgi:hypothetical protein
MTLAVPQIPQKDAGLYRLRKKACFQAIDSARKQ